MARLIGCLLCLLIASGLSAAEEPQAALHKAQFAPMLETRSQTVRVKLAFADSAARAKLRPLPLFGGADWAVTSRWDDNTLTHLKMKQVLLAHGYRGTFFLNAPSHPAYGKSYGLLGDHPAEQLGRLLATDGITIGGHSLTHPMLTYQNRNRIFEEVLGSRIALEAAHDALVNAYAFSFCDFRSELEGTAVQRDIALALGRAGYLQVPNQRFARDGCWPRAVAALLPPDGQPIDDVFGKYLADGQLKKENPAVSFSMHTWYDTPAAWAKFEGELDRYGRRKNWWYCNQNEYGAYRAQYVRAAEGRLTRQGKSLSFTFQRPVLVDLNDPIPLTFELTGVRPAEILGIEASGARIERIKPGNGTASPQQPVQFHLYHVASETLPQRIDHLTTDGGKVASSKEFPGVRARWTFDGKVAKLQLGNGTESTLRGVRVTYRLPLLRRRGVVRRKRFALAPNKTYRNELAFDDLQDDPRYRIGNYFLVAQVDFMQGDKAGRIYLTTRSPGTATDGSYPRRGFSVLGPVPREQVDLDNVTVGQLRKEGLKLTDGTKLGLKPIDPDVAQPLGAEVIAVRGQWNNRGVEPCVYFLVSTVHASAEHDVLFRCNATTVPAIWLHGKRVDKTARLKPGTNQLILAYEPPTQQRFAREHAGPALRIVDAKTGQRLNDIEYKP